MNWDAIGAIAEAIGAAGVIASLLYLAVQVRANTRASAVEAKLASTRFYTDFFGSFIQSPELNDLFMRGRKDFESLPSDDYYRFSNLAFQAGYIFSGLYFQFRQSTLSEDDWSEYRAMAQYWLRSPGVQQWWSKAGKYMFGSDFVAFVEAEMQRSDAA
jgi:hypothetical protein